MIVETPKSKVLLDCGIKAGATNSEVYPTFNTKEFDVLDRSQRDNILKEIEFSLSDCADESCQLEAGRMLTADIIIVGSIGKVGTRLALNVQLIDVETGATKSSAANIYASMDALVDGLRILVASLIRNIR